MNKYAAYELGVKIAFYDLTGEKRAVDWDVVLPSIAGGAIDTAIGAGLGTGLGAGIGALGGNAPRGALRGAMTGAGTGLGANLGSRLGEVGKDALPYSLLGAGTGGLLSYLLSREAVPDEMGENKKKK